MATAQGRSPQRSPSQIVGHGERSTIITRLCFSRCRRKFLLHGVSPGQPRSPTELEKSLRRALCAGCTHMGAIISRRGSPQIFILDGVLSGRVLVRCDFPFLARSAYRRPLFRVPVRFGSRTWPYEMEEI